MRLATVSLMLASSLTLLASGPVPRPSKEFTIVLPSGKQDLLSKYRGKVVMLACMFTTCPHCQALSKVMTKLQGELGPKGFQALGVAFNDEVNTPNNAVNARVTSNFISEFGVGFPMGFAARESVMSYLGLSDVERWAVPQVVIIDKTGVIRAQSAAGGTADLATESYLRTYLQGLLNEGAPAKSSAPSKSPAKKTADKKAS